MFLTDLADILRDAGLAVTEIDGWKTRGFNGGKRWGGPEMEKPRSGIVHHTAGPSRSRAGGRDLPSKNVLLNGYSGLPGPLSQLGLGFSGRFYVIAAGLCNHAGTVTERRFENLRSIGIEAEHPGNAEPWPERQYEAYVAGAAALSAAYGIEWVGHKEVAYPRGNKIDPTFNMTTFRANVARVAKPASPGSTSGRTLTIGSTGADVAALQAGLNRMFPTYSRLTVDKSYGPATAAVVTEFQRRAKRAGVYVSTVDGITGPATRKALRHYGIRLP